MSSGVHNLPKKGKKPMPARAWRHTQLWQQLYVKCVDLVHREAPYHSAKDLAQKAVRAADILYRDAFNLPSEIRLDDLPVAERRAVRAHIEMTRTFTED